MQAIGIWNQHFVRTTLWAAGNLSRDAHAWQSDCRVEGHGLDPHVHRRSALDAVHFRHAVTTVSHVSERNATTTVIREVRTR
jgi:hypothetical protein